jgi:hypothetical protein
LGNRLTHFGFNQDRILDIEFQKRRIVQIGVVGIVYAKLRERGKTPQISQPDIAGGICLTRLERGGNGGLVGNDPVDDAVQIRCTLAPIVRIFAQAHVAASHPFVEDERTGADGGAQVRTGERIAIAITMLRHNRQFRR